MIDEKSWEDALTKLPQQVPEEPQASVDITLVEAIRAVLWGRDELLSARYRRLKDRHPLTGHSYVASELYYNMSFFHSLMQPACFTIGKITHWFIMHRDIYPIIDLIPEEVPNKTRIPYTNATPRAFRKQLSVKADELYEAVGKMRRELELEKQDEQKLSKGNPTFGQDFSVLKDFNRIVQHYWATSSTTGTSNYTIYLGQGNTATFTGNR